MESTHKGSGPQGDFVPAPLLVEGQTQPPAATPPTSPQTGEPSSAQESPLPSAAPPVGSASSPAAEPSPLVEGLAAGLLTARYQPGERFELGAIRELPKVDGKKKTEMRSAFFLNTDDGREMALAWLKERDGKVNLYIGSSPIKTDVTFARGKRTEDVDVAVARVLLLDPDPDDTSAESRAAAAAMADDARSLLRERLGINVPLVDSGRGRQVWIPHERFGPEVVLKDGRPSVEDKRQELRKRTNHVLARRLARPGAKVDKTTHNTSRLMRLPGSVNLRTGERARVLDPGDGREISLADLEQLVNALEVEQRGASSSASNDPRHGQTFPDRLNPTEILRGIPEGKRDTTLFRFACRLRKKGLTVAEAEALVLQAAASCDPPFSDDDARKKVRNAWKYGVDASTDDEALAVARRVVRRATKRARTKPAAAFAPEALAALALLKVGDPGAFAGARSALVKAKVSLREVDRLVTETAEQRARDEQPADVKPDHPYEATPSGLVWHKPTKEGDVRVPLTNFVARIVGDVSEDDGVETVHVLEIEATLPGRTARFPVAASAFGAMNWPIEHLGASAIVHAGMGTRDHARAAIQLTSDTVPERRVYTHLGWQDLPDGSRVYLHAGGAIGAQGEVGMPWAGWAGRAGPNQGSVVVRISDALSRYHLPAPPEGEQLHLAVRASLGLLTLASPSIAATLLAAVYRAPTGSADFAIHLMGPSGAFKTETSALAQQHFGAGLDARHLPASWSSTANSLEGTAFAVADALFTIDDFSPQGSSHDIARLQRDADRLFRNQGNGAARGRMRADGSLRSPKPPRGLILSSGEDAPRGQSLRARLMIVELSPGDVDPARLTLAQRNAADGLYAQSMSGYVRWLASRRDLAARLREDKERLRDSAGVDSSSHRRTPVLVADLGVGLHYFLDFATSVGAIDLDERLRLWDLGWRGLLEAARRQGGHQDVHEPTRRFLDLLSGALAAGRAHVAASDGSVPASPERWGWRQQTVVSMGEGHDRWHECGDRVGWIDHDDLYLEPEASHAAAQRFGGDGGDALAIGAATLRKRLFEKGLLASTEMRGAERRLVVRRVLQGMRRDVLHIRAATLSSSFSPAQPAQCTGGQLILSACVGPVGNLDRPTIPLTPAGTNLAPTGDGRHAAAGGTPPAGGAGAPATPNPIALNVVQPNGPGGPANTG